MGRQWPARPVWARRRRWMWRALWAGRRAWRRRRRAGQREECLQQGRHGACDRSWLLSLLRRQLCAQRLAQGLTDRHLTRVEGLQPIRAPVDALLVIERLLAGPGDERLE